MLSWFIKGFILTIALFINFDYCYAFSDKWLDKAIDQIKMHEGWNSTTYKDSKGISTIGYGFNINESYIRTYIKKYSHDVNKLTRSEGGKILRSIIIDIHLPSLRSIYKHFDKLPSNVKIALLDMHYNLGRTKLLKFKKMNEAINKRNFSKASYEAYNSKWRKDVGERAIHIINLIKYS